MKRAFFVILGLFIAIGAYIVWNTFSTVISTGPMISMRLKIAVAGKPLPPEAIKKVEYCFSEAREPNGARGLKGEMRTAWIEGDSFVLNGPYSITSRGFSSPVTQPQFQSLFIRVSLTDQKTFVVSFPTISSTKLSGPIYIDLPQ